jgi:hypothetical protein
MPHKKFQVSFYSKQLLDFCLVFFLSLFTYSSQSQSIFTSALNSTGDTKKLSAGDPRYPNYFFEWSVGESSNITTNTSGNLQVTHGLLQGYLLNDPVVPTGTSWYPDEIKIFPNPVVTEFSVELLTGINGVVQFTLYNSSGVVIFVRSLVYQAVGQTERFNIGYLPPGSYILKVTLSGFPESGGYLQKQGGFKIIKTL